MFTGTVPISLAWMLVGYQLEHTTAVTSSITHAANAVTSSITHAANAGNLTGSQVGEATALPTLPSHPRQRCQQLQQR